MGFVNRKVNCEATKMEKVINDRIPHVGEKIFRSVDSDSLIQCLSVSTYWQELAKNELLKRWKRKIFEACKSGKTEIVKLLLEEEEIEDINAIDQSGGTAFYVGLLKWTQRCCKVTHRSFRHYQH